MIVKKVPTKKSAAPKSRGLHARNLCDYIAGPGAGDAGEKVEHRGAMNMLNIDHDGQVQEMADLAEVARRCPQPVQHWIVSWRQGEQPTAAQAERAVGLFLAEMGLCEHQCIYALHRNTDNYHLHLAINRVHPDTERVVTVNGGFDIEIAHRAIARIEHEQGWQREIGGRYRVLEGGELQRADPMAPEQRRPTTLALDFENQTGQKSAQRIAIDDGAEVLRRARDWDDLHARLGEKGMHFERKGSGAILWVGDVAVKASTVGRDCSMSALEKRLGDFVPARDVQVSKSRDLEPVEPGATGWKEYAAERDAHYATKTQQRDLLREQHRDEREGMFVRHRQERSDTFEGDWRGKGEALNALRSMLAARQAQEKAELKESQQRDLAMEREHSLRWPPFENWLRERASPELAEQWRFRDRVPARIVGDNDDGARPRDIRAFTAEAHGWEVLYRRGDLPAGTPSFVDHGREIRIHDLQRDSVLAALQLSAQKWGTIQVYGSDNYKRLCVDLAVEHGFRITNPELQEALANDRGARLPQHHDRSRDVGDLSSTRPPVRDVSEAYHRHLEDVSGGIQRGNVDASRVDALIAVRLRATGYSRDQVEQAIRTEAPKQWPDETRDWNAYAKRATDHAFSLSGERQLRELARTRDALLKIEGRHLERSLEIRPRRELGLGR